MRSRRVTLEEVELTPLSVLGPEPRLGVQVYEARLAAARSRMTAMGLGSLLVYADREHPAGASYLTGFDPRFEEALVVVLPDGPPVIIAGNESLAMVSDGDIEAVGVLCQSFSLAGQKRETQRRLSDALREAGVDGGKPVGVVGWRPIPYADAPASALPLAVPGFVLDEIAVVAADTMVDASGILGGVDGLRARNEADQLALNEHRSTRASQHVWRALEALRIGISELDLSVEMRLTGLPLSAHLMLTTGSNGVVGLRSPGDRIITEGDVLSVAVGLWGGLTSRAGRVLRHDSTAFGEEEVAFAAGYFSAVATWYEALRIGASTSDITDDVVAELAHHGISPLLNPGHLQHIDEWLDSPFISGSQHRLHSGMSLQADIIPVGARPTLAANCEDALALADVDLRAELRERFPEAWARIQARREFITERLGLTIHEEVLPFSDRQVALPPALMSTATLLVSR